MRVSAFLVLTLSLSAGACGPAAQKHEHPTPLSAEQHEEDAKEHERIADLEEQGVEPTKGTDDTRCIDQGQEPLYSGGERTRVMMPCWTQAERNSKHMLESAANRKAAREHRAWAKRLVELETTTCSRLTVIERETSPLSHIPDILAVDEYRENGALSGAKVTLRKVPGLTLEWVNASIACQQARAAKVGYDRSFMPLSPLALPKTSTSAKVVGETVIVTLRSKDPIVAAEIYGRASRVLAEGE